MSDTSRETWAKDFPGALPHPLWEQGFFDGEYEARIFRKPMHDTSDGSIYSRGYKAGFEVGFRI